MSEREPEIIVRPAHDDKADLAAVKVLLQETFAYHAQVAGNEPGLTFRPAAQDAYLEDCIKFVQEAARSKMPTEQAFLAYRNVPRKFGLKSIEKPVGLIMIRIQRDYYYATEFYGYIEQLIVTQEARSIGIGERLLEAAYAWLRSRQVHTATLKVYGPNLDALHFYQHEGFQILRHELIKHF